MRAFILYVYSICAVSETIDLCYILSEVCNNVCIIKTSIQHILYSSKLLFICSKIYESCFMENIYADRRFDSTCMCCIKLVLQVVSIGPHNNPIEIFLQ